MADHGSAKGAGEVLEPSQAEAGHARRVAEAKATVPHAYFEAEAPGVQATTAELVMAAARALQDFPKLNGSYRDARYELHSRVNVGVALTVPSGLVYATVPDAGAKTAETVEAELATLAERALSGEITQPELSGATFSLADLAPLGLSRAELIVNRGQAAILAAGARDSALTLTLACDHRIVQAPDAAGFLARVVAELTA